MPSLSSAIYMELCICLATCIAHSVSSASVLKYLCWVFLNQSSVTEHLGGFHVLAIVNSAIAILVHIFL